MFPVEREEKRKTLLQAVERVRDIVAAGADEAEILGALPQATVNALNEAGLFSLQLPALLGGAEADLVTQFEVVEALTYIDTSAGWCTLIGVTSIAWPAIFLPDEAIEQIFAKDRAPTAAGVFLPAGQAVPVEGGYRVSGRWSYASGIRHAEWITAGVKVVRTQDALPERRMVVFPTAKAQIYDNWHVAGLRGTGSCDFSVSDLFVPEAFTWDATGAQPQRGGLLYRIGMPGFVMHIHAAFALGIGRRALDAIVDFAHGERPGFRPSALIGRPVFHRALGQCDLQLRAARALVIQLFEEAWRTVCSGGNLTPRQHAELRGAAVLATEVASDVTARMFRYGGGSVLFLTNILQRCLRDLTAAAQHRMVSDSSYEQHGKFTLGLPDANPNG